MADREKLIEAVNSFNFPIESGGCTIGAYIVPYSIQEPLVDHLIANGVTIQQNGVWVGEADGYADGELVYDVWYCSECNYCIDDGTDDPSLLPNYCPVCGARMLPEAPKGE